MSEPESPVRVRAAVPDDGPALVEFNLAMARETERRELDREVLAAGVAAVLAEPRRGFYLVAEAGAAVVAGLLVTFEWSDWRNGEFWWVQSVYVEPRWRRRGLYRRLYGEVKARATARGGVCGVRLYVERDNARAQRTYAALGMHETPYRIYEEPLPG